MHVPVLLKEVIKIFDPKPNQNYIDCTLGGGGHTLEILKKVSPKGKVLGLDLSLQAIQNLKEYKKENQDISNRLIIAHENFSKLKKVVKEKDFQPVHGILFDFGLSTDLLKKSNRGFTFMKNEPLDMRYDFKNQTLTAKKIINHFTEKELNNLFKKYGGEKWSYKIAREIIQARKHQVISTTRDLRRIIESSLGYKFHIKSLARIFQALRIQVNNELENIKDGLAQSFSVLAKKGKIIAISYHSLEDKIVKDYFKENTKLEPIFKKPIVPSKEEVKDNNKARSAKLRAAYKK